MMKKAQSVEAYIDQHPEWEAALHLLRELLLSAEVEETIKWGAPAYTVDRKNIIGIGAFKQYVGLWFHQGVFLTDPAKKLMNAQEGVTKALRQWRFASLEEVEQQVELIRQYIDEAIVNQKAGKVIKANKKKPLVIPQELQVALDQDARLYDQFQSFTPGKQREFTDYIAEAKRAATKLSRLEKIKPMILAGIGLNDKYR